MAFTMTQTQKDQVIYVKMQGALDEHAIFDTTLEPLNGKVEINCRGIDRINSTGIKAWLRFFQTHAKNAQIVFHECSVAIVEQMNLISNFSFGGEIASVFVPFVCDACYEELVVLFKSHDLVQTQFHMPSVPCPKCKQEAHFDDVVEEYFSFLNKTTA